MKLKGQCPSPIVLRMTELDSMPIARLMGSEYYEITSIEVEVNDDFKGTLVLMIPSIDDERRACVYALPLKKSDS